MRKTGILLMLLIFFTVKNFGQSSLTAWEELIASPSKTNGVVVLPSPENLKYWNIQIFKRQYANGTFTDVPVSKEIFTGINSYYIPARYQEDTYSYEYMYQVKGFSPTNQVIYDSGKNSVTGDGTPKVLQKTWVCDGYDYAYKICLYTLPGYANGSLVLEGPGYVYEYIRPFELPCFIPNYSDYPYFNTVHGLDDGWAVDVDEDTQNYNYSILKLLNDGESYYDKFGYQITTEDLYAVRKMNWKWPSGSIRVDNITDASVFALADIDYIIQYLNLYSDIAALAPDEPVLDCFYYGEGEEGEYNYTDPIAVTDCIMSGTDAIFLDESLGGNADIPTLADIISNCQNSGGVSYLSDVTVVDISDLKKPISIVNFDRDDLMDENGVFSFPPFVLEKGTYWVTLTFLDGSFAQFFKSVNSRLINQVEDNLLVDFTIFPVPIIGNEFSVAVQAYTSTSFTYEVLDNSGKVVYTTKVKVSIDDEFDFDVKIDGILPSGNVFHRFVFEDGSITTVNSIK